MPRPCYFLKMALVLALIVNLAGCEGGKMVDPAAFKSHLSEVPDSAWKLLSEKRIFFGHQSVGDNIMAGIGDIQSRDDRIKLKISKLEAATAIEEPGFYHSHIGRNEDPKSKVDDFAEKMENGLGHSADIAFFKFCYIDVNPSTDAASLFGYYQNTMESLKSKFPQTTFIHSTMPLVKLQDGPKAWIKSILGRPLSGTSDNIKRDEYNRLLIAEYSGKEPIFDLAKAESTDPDGVRSVATKDGRSFPTLVSDFTDDDGHLNETGRQVVAAGLLRVLALQLNGNANVTP